MSPEAAAIAAQMPAAELARLLNVSPWLTAVSARAGGGYRDNLLLSSYHSVASPFASAGADAMISRLPDAHAEAFFFLSVDTKRFTASTPMRQETQAFGQGEWRYREGPLLFGLGGQAYYLEQMFDLSTTDLERVVALLKVRGAAAAPRVRWAPVATFWTEAQGKAVRETDADHLDDQWRSEGRWRAGWKFLPAAEAIVDAGVLRRSYDDRMDASADGVLLPGTRLAVVERDIQAGIDLRIGHWKAATRIAGLACSDNGSGYFGYHRRRLAQSLEWAAGRWLARDTCSAGGVRFDVQTVGEGPDLRVQVKDEYRNDLRIERKLGRAWTVLGEYIWERNRSNNALLSYRQKEVSLGLQWSWNS